MPRSSPVVVDGFNLKKIINLWGWHDGECWLWFYFRCFFRVGLWRWFINKVLKCKACCYFIFLQQPISERAGAGFTAGCVYGGNPAVAGGRNTHLLMQRNDWECGARAELNKLFWALDSNVCAPARAGSLLWFPLSGSQGKSGMWCYFHYTALYFLLLLYRYTFLSLHVSIYYIHIYIKIYMTYIFLYFYIFPLYIFLFLFIYILIYICKKIYFLLNFLFNFVLLFRISFLLGALTSPVWASVGCAPQLGFKSFHSTTPDCGIASNPLLDGTNFTFCQNYNSRAQSSLLTCDAWILGGRWVHIKGEKSFILQVRL